MNDRFFRPSGTSASGSGRGLSIVARTVEYFGAQLRWYVAYSLSTRNLEE
jgi:signal transduction histidine kinase